ncbi:MAG TPA: hypothetical protein VK509_10060 [Polyangiales bacterium]|nr:hypothetical protein [Polyangiales bacterium]
MADGWLSSLLGYHRLKDEDDNVFPQRSTLKIIGGTLADDEDEKQTVLDLSALGGGPISYGSPSALVYGGAGADGVATAVARADHVHALPALPGGANVWDGRVYPTSSPTPHAQSDDFLTGSLDAAWLDWDHGAWVTHTVESPPNQLVHTGTGNGTVRSAGRYKAIPSNEFQFLAFIGIDCSPAGITNASGVSVGLALFSNAANSAAVLNTIELFDNNPTTGSTARLLQQRTGAIYTGGGAVITRTGVNQGMWLRMRALVGGAATTVTADWSIDGIRWQTMMGGEHSVGYAAQHYGLVATCNTGAVMRATHSHFRVWSGAGAYGHNYARNGGYL